MEMGYGLRTKSLEDSIVGRSRHDGHTFIVAEPGDCTRYVLMFTDLDKLQGASVATNGGPGFILVTSMADTHNVRSMFVTKDGFVHWQQDVLGVLTESIPSSVTLGELIAHVVGCECVTSEEFLRDYGAALKEARS